MAADPTRELKEFREKLITLQRSRREFNRKCANEMAARLIAKVKKRTPVWNKQKVQFHLEELDDPARADDIWARWWKGHVGGWLRKNWFARAPQTQGDNTHVTVFNPVHYASYVEYGHRQTPGRFVGALGRRLKANWVPGHHMLEISKQELQREMPGELQKMQDDWLREGLK
jgi:hypothetical protein